MDDARKIAQIKGVMRFGGSWQKVGDGALVHLQRCGDDLGHNLFEGVVEGLGHEVPVEDAREYGGHGLVVELVDGDDVEVAEEAGRDVVAAAARRPHRAHRLDVGELDFGLVLAVVPVPVVVPLAEELDGRLGAVRLHLGHVHVVHEDYALLADWRAEHSFSTLQTKHLGVSGLLEFIGVNQSSS